MQTSRLSLYETITVDGVDEKDALSINMNDFISSIEQKNYTTVRSDERARPDLLAYRIYRNPRLWWFLLKVNGITNPFNVVPGTKILVPTIKDYYDFIRTA